MSIEENILNGILSVIEKISNAQFQKKAWVDNKVHPYAFFEESIHQLFDDYELSEVLDNYKIYAISNDQLIILKILYKSLDCYSDEKMSWMQAVDPKELLEDPRWHEIQKMAKDVLEAFNYQKNSTHRDLL
jgi:hypothetical protein